MCPIHGDNYSLFSTLKIINLKIKDLVTLFIN